MNRTKPYADDATDRSTGETSMTAWVVSVLLMPMNAPLTMTATITALGVSTPAAMTAMTTPSAARLTYRTGGVPNRACRRGAKNTLNAATSRPQPVNTRPSSWAFNFIGYGA